MGDGKRESGMGEDGVLGLYGFRSVLSRTTTDVVLMWLCHVASCGWQAGQYGAVGCGCGYLGQAAANGIIKLKR